MLTSPPRPLTPLLWLPFLAVPFLEPDIYANGIARDLAVLATALFAAAAIAQTPANSHYRIDRYDWLFLLLCLLPAAITLANQSAQAPWFVWRQSLYLSGVWLVYAMLRQQNNTWFASTAWTVLLTLFAHLYVIYALIEAFYPQWIPGDNGSFLFWSDKTAHFPGPLRQQNQQALFLVITIVMIWRQAVVARQHLRWELAALLPIGGVFLTASRSGALVLLLAALLVWLFARCQSRALFMLGRTLFVGAMLSVVILAITPNPTESGVVSHVQTALSDSAPSIRVMVWTICLSLWLDHLWLGVGWGNLAAHLMDSAAPVIAAHPEFTPIASQLAGGVTRTHNLVLQFLVEGGVIAGSALLLLFVALANRARRWWQQPPAPTSAAASGWICAVIMLAHGMVSVAIMEPFFMVLLAISLAVCFANHDG